MLRLEDILEANFAQYGTVKQNHTQTRVEIHVDESYLLHRDRENHSTEIGKENKKLEKKYFNQR